MSGEKRASDPGATRHGNFINYYDFHPAEERVRQLPRELIQLAQKRPTAKFVALDVGCNAGDLTLELHEYLSENLPGREVSILGIDLDPTLIERAREKNDRPGSVAFECLDFFSSDRESVIAAYLNQHGVERFDTSFCFSVTMWVHLNEGDAGLGSFLSALCRLSEAVLVEPQPWRCYRAAARRLRRAGQPPFHHLDQLEIRGDVQAHIEAMLAGCQFAKCAITGANDWGRTLLLYARPSDGST